MGVAVALVVTVSMVAAVTLLPGLLGLAGTKIDKLSIHRKTHVAKPADETVSGPLGAPRRQPPGALRRRRASAPCAPSPSRRSACGSARPTTATPPRDTTQRTAYDQLAEGFGPGFNGPIQVVVEVPSAADQAAVDRVHDALQADPGVAAVTAPVFNAAGDTAVLTANPTTAPQDEAHRRARPPPPRRRAAGRRRRHRRDGCRSPARRWSPT